MPMPLTPGPTTIQRPLPAAGGPAAKRSRWDLLLVCVAVYVATAVGRVHELYPVLQPLRPALISAALAVALYLLQQTGARNVVRLRGTTTTCVVGMLVWVSLSIPGALSQGIAFRFLTDFFAKTVLMYAVIAGCVRTVRDVERLALVYFAATAVYAAVVLTRFQLGGGDDWRLSHLYDYDANDFATLIATTIPLGLYFVLANRRLFVRLLCAAGLVILAVVDIRTGSRGGFLALIAVVAFVLFRFTTIPALSRVAGLAVIVAVVFFTASDRYWEQMQTVLNPQEDYNTTTETGRVKIWERGLGYMARDPVSGVGAGNFPVAEGTISPMAGRAEYGAGVRWGAAHNSFVQVGAELGIPGLVFFVGAIVSALVALRRVARSALRIGPAAIRVSRLAQSLTAALVGFIVGGFFLSLGYSDMLYTLLALAVGLAKVARADVPSPPIPAARKG